MSASDGSCCIFALSDDECCWRKLREGSKKEGEKNPRNKRPSVEGGSSKPCIEGLQGRRVRTPMRLIIISDSEEFERCTYLADIFAWSEMAVL